MKATLTIEVPDDFKKGECRKCPILSSWINPNYKWCLATRRLVPMSVDYLFITDCPLEIHDECTVDCEKRYTCKHCIQGMYCNSTTRNKLGTPCCCEPIGE